MRKIPTVFRRDPENMKHVLPEVVEGCEWVLAGQGTPTRKYDGTCVRLDEDGKWLARREVRPGKATPADFLPVGRDENTGKVVGWEPVEASGFAKWHADALRNDEGSDFAPGTYELCGPKVQRNPEALVGHALISHAEAQVLNAPRTFEELRDYLLARDWMEGLVWHHEDGRMAKLKRRDFA